MDRRTDKPLIELQLKSSLKEWKMYEMMFNSQDFDKNKKFEPHDTGRNVNKWRGVTISLWTGGQGQPTPIYTYGPTQPPF